MARRLALHGAGLALIALGVAITGPATSWPSTLTLAPVGGAALVIAARAQRTWWADNPLVAGLGRASYSIYLWHWPIVVWLYDNAIAVTWAVAAVALAGMVGLGLASYWLVERRLTDWFFQPKPRRWALGASAAAATLALTLVAIASHGLETLRTLAKPPQVRAAMADDRRAQRDWAYPQVCGHRAAQGALDICRIGDPAARQVLLIGDFHAQELAPRYAHAFDGRPGAGLTLMTMPGCIPVPAAPGAHDCRQPWRAAYRSAENAGFSRVVITSAWQLYFDPTDASPHGLVAVDRAEAPAGQPQTLTAIADATYQRLAVEVRRFQAHGAQVVLIGSTPRAKAGDPRVLYANAFWRGVLDAPPLSRAAFEAQTAADRQRLAWVARTTGAVLIDPVDGLCDGDACPVQENGRTLYKDYGHFRASMMTSPRFAFLDRWLAPQLAAAPAAAPIRLK